MGEITSQIEREIRDKRADLGRNLNELEDRARELADWRTHYRNHSGAFVGVAFSAGVALAMLAIPSSRSRSFELTHPEVDMSHDPYHARQRSLYEAVEPEVRSRRRWTSGTGTTARAVRQASETWGAITDALLRTASAKAIQFVTGLIPDVKNYLDRDRFDRDRDERMYG